MTVVTSRSPISNSPSIIPKAEEILPAICDSFPGMMAYTGLDERLLLCNQAFLDRWKIPREWILGRTVRELIGDDRYRAYEPQINRVRAGETVKCELPITRPGHAVAYVSIQLTPHRDAQSDQIMGYSAFVTDVTERVSLNESESFLNSLIENIPNMIFVKDAASLRFVRFNKAGEELLGYSRSELMGKNDYDFFPKAEADQFTSADRAVIEHRKMTDVPEEVIHTRVLGRRVLHTKKIPIFDANGCPRYLLGISEDVTEKRNAEIERNRSREAIHRLQTEREVRERFVSALSHDLRSPLTAARAAAELLINNENHPDLREKLVSRLLGSIDRADRMIRDLLDSNLIRAGQRLHLQVGRCDLSVIAQESIDELTLTYGDRFVLNGPESMAGWWSAPDLRRTLDNLLGNAVKYGSSDSLVSTNLRVLPDERVEFSVHNHGNELSQAEMDQIFRDFSRTGSAIASGRGGWGLGLTLVRGIVEAHGGEVSVRSGKGDGTAFTVTLPRDCRPAGATATST